MLTDRDVVNLVRGTYAYSFDPPVAWDHFSAESRTNVICWGIKIVDDVAVAVFRGSHSPKDWILDLSAWICWTSVGWLHWGFHVGTKQVAKELLAFVDARGLKRIVIGGHSLGAAHARLVAAWLVRMGRPPVACIGWGEPLAGFRALCRLTKQIPHNRTYVNTDGRERDPVTLVPLRFWIFRYRCAAEIILVRNVPLCHQWGPFRLHHIWLYQSATPARVIC